jgi:hypothetical protein
MRYVQTIEAALGHHLIIERPLTADKRGRASQSDRGGNHQRIQTLGDDKRCHWQHQKTKTDKRLIFNDIAAGMISDIA